MPTPQVAACEGQVVSVGVEGVEGVLDAEKVAGPHVVQTRSVVEPTTKPEVAPLCPQDREQPAGLSQQRVAVALFSVHGRTVQALHEMPEPALFMAQQAVAQAPAASVTVGETVKLVSPVMFMQTVVFCMTFAEHEIAAGAA